MRRSPFVLLVAGVMLLSVGLLAATTAIAQQREQVETMRRDAAQVAQAFGASFERARALDLLLAQNPVFAPPAGTGVDNAGANRALAYLEQLFPETIGEACLIDERGYELARVIEGTAADVGDLSTSEEQNAFLAATLALRRPGLVYQSPPYVSPDTKNWVVSNSTWIRQPSGRRLVVHFEVAFDSFRRYLAGSSTGRHLAVVDRISGRTILGDSTALPVASPGERYPLVPAASGPPPAGKGAASGALQVRGRPAAASRIIGPADNANDWSVVEWSTGRVSLLPPWVGGVASLAGMALVGWSLIILRRQRSALQAVARLDPLTGLANRTALEEALGEALAGAAASEGDAVAVLVLDLDGFKQINDNLGHDKGDLVLREIGRRLHANTFGRDTAARLGGDEFAVVLRQVRPSDDIAAVAHRLREALVRAIDIDGIARSVGASVGAALYPDHGRSSAELLGAADAAMYEAKRGGGGVCLYDGGLYEGGAASGQGATISAGLAVEQD
jgi:diguanylate cyclase (GGDEF)-like protein